MSKEPELYGDPLSNWREIPWWPKGDATLHLAAAGHDREIVVNIEGVDYYEPIPRPWFEFLVSLLPESWKLENRGTRIEIHPSGRLFNGFSDMDVSAVLAALDVLGHKWKCYDYREDSRGIISESS
jgi:hypothetical protein